MNADLLDWTLCRSFLAILQEGSLSRAAVRLRVTHPTISRHLEELEQRLGTKLFVRSTSGLTPTDLGASLAATAEAMQLAAEAFIRRASAETDQICGSVRITASEIVGAEILPPLLAELREKHTGLAYEVSLTRSTEDLLRRDADIAIRMARPEQSDLVARKVGQMSMKLYAHADWVRKHGFPNSLADLAAAHELIGYDRDPAMLQAFAARGLSLDRDAFGFRSDNDLALLAALRAGFGVGAGYEIVMQRDPQMVNVLPELEQVLEVWLAVPSALRNVARIAATLEALAIGLGRQVRRDA
jgi:DNA-binding transcriptional LysR family regulator